MKKFKLYEYLQLLCEDISNKHVRLYSKYLSKAGRLLGRLDYLEDFSVLPGKVRRFYVSCLSFYRTVVSLLNDKQFSNLPKGFSFYLDSLPPYALYVQREFLDYINDQTSSTSKQSKEANLEDLKKLTVLTYGLWELVQYLNAVLSEATTNESTKENLQKLTDDVTKKVADLYERDGMMEDLLPQVSKEYFLNFPKVAPEVGLNRVLLTIKQEVSLQNADLRSKLYYFSYNSINQTYSVLNYESDTKIEETLYDFVCSKKGQTYYPISAVAEKEEYRNSVQELVQSKEPNFLRLYNVEGSLDNYEYVKYVPVTTGFNVTRKDRFPLRNVGTLNFINKQGVANE